MNIPLFVCLIFGLQFIYWIVGRISSKNISNQEDYFLAGKNVRLFPLMMTFLATQVGGGIILGAADEAFLFGWPVIFFPLGSALGLILLGAGIGKRLAGFQVSTIAQIFEVFYKSPFLRKIAGFLSVVSLFMILVAQIIASHKFLVSLGLNNSLLFIIFWSIVIIYTAQGGLRAVISTDMIQAAFFTVIFVFSFIFVVFSDTSASMPLPQLSEIEPVSSKLYGWLLMPLLFMVIEQDMGQRCFAGETPRVVSRAAMLAGIGTMIVCIVPVFFGCLAKNINLEIPSGGSVLMTAVAETTTPLISALVGCAVLAAVISTATSLINAISSNISSDFNLSFMKEKESVRVVQWVTCAISIAAIFFTFYFDNIVGILVQSYELTVSCMFVPIFIALFKKNGNFLSALLSIVFGTVGFILFRLYPIEFPKEVASTLLSLLGYMCGEIIILLQTKETKATSE